MTNEDEHVTLRLCKIFSKEEIVHCKECVNCKQFYGELYCNVPMDADNTSVLVKPDDFCSRGRRK